MFELPTASADHARQEEHPAEPRREVTVELERECINERPVVLTPLTPAA